MKSIKESIRRRPLVVGIIIAVTVVVLAVAYTLWSSRVWADYQSSYQSWNQDMRSKTEETLALPAASSKERSDKLTRFKELVASIDKQKDSHCAINGLVGWQQFAANKEKQEECRKTSITITAFNHQLQGLVAYLESESQLAATLASASKSSGKLTEKQWANQVSIWSDAKQSIETMTAVNEFTSVKEGAVKKVTTIEGAWKQVVAANKAKSETQYVDAEKDLIQAYAELKDVSEASVDGFSKLLVDAQKAYDQVFAK